MKMKIFEEKKNFSGLDEFEHEEGGTIDEFV